MAQFTELPSTFLERFKELRDKFENDTTRSKMSLEECEECLVYFKEIYTAAKNILDDIGRKEIDHGNDPIYFYGFKREYLGNVFDLVPESVTKDLLIDKRIEFSDLYIACSKFVSELSKTARQQSTPVQPAPVQSITEPALPKLNHVSLKKYVHHFRHHIVFDFR